jgi:hypothetical protein
MFWFTVGQRNLVAALCCWLGLTIAMLFPSPNQTFTQASRGVGRVMLFGLVLVLIWHSAPFLKWSPLGH